MAIPPGLGLPMVLIAVALFLIERGTRYCMRSKNTQKLGIPMIFAGAAMLIMATLETQNKYDKAQSELASL